MTIEMVTEIGRQAIETTILVSAPILGLSLIVGLLVSTFQAMTQINEATLTFVPKVLAIFAATLVVSAVDDGCLNCLYDPAHHQHSVH
jgi:flagellar biosynthetic protein FliQ